MKSALTLLTALLLLKILAVGQESSALSPKSPIPLTNAKGRMDHFSVDVKGQRLFVAANANHTIEVIDLRACRQVQTIRNLDTPQGVFYDNSTNLLFVTNEGDGTMKIFDGTGSSFWSP